MTKRYFAEAPIAEGHTTLTGQEAHHFRRVMRGKTGDSIILFDGTGAEFDAQVIQVDRNALSLRILASREVDRELSFTLTLGIALPKGDRQRWLVEKLVELGVSALVPLVTEHGVAKLGGNALQRLERAVVEASKQCERNRLMKVHPPHTLADFVLKAPTSSNKLIAHPRAGLEAPHVPAARTVADTIVAIGPEGGFSPKEVAAAMQAHWRGLDLGPRVLRTETAAVAIASWIVLSALP